MRRPFFCFPIRATPTIIVVEHIELDSSNNPAREGLRLPTCGPLTKTVDLVVMALPTYWSTGFTACAIDNELL